MGDVIYLKDKQTKAVQYVRDIKATRDLPYEQKFNDFLKLCAESKQKQFEVILVAFPEILGDSHEEVMRTLSHAAEAGLMIAVAKPSL